MASSWWPGLSSLTGVTTLGAGDKNLCFYRLIIALLSLPGLFDFSCFFFAAIAASLGILCLPAPLTWLERWQARSGSISATAAPSGFRYLTIKTGEISAVQQTFVASQSFLGEISSLSAWRHFE